MRKAIEQKDVSIGSPEGGGLAVPEVIAREIQRLELLFSPVRRLVKVVQTSTSDYKELINTRGTSAGWVGETDPRTATDTSQLRERTPTHGELYAYPQVTEWSLDDIFFNVQNWLSNEVSEQFAIAEGAAVINGDGANKPTGMLATAPTLAADDAATPRAANVYQYVPSDSGGAAAVLPDELITLVYMLNSAYRPGSSWTMNSNTTAAVRKLKNADGDYLWQPGLQAGQPDRLLGYPVETWEQMPDIAANAFPIAFGNFARGYLLVDRTGLRMTRDQVTNPGYVRFYIRRRVGGTVLNNNAVKWLRTVGT
jgi:HK97 family phage major capsid protein